nr:uncharacterized protein LOC112940524 [Solanum lycopersicum]
MPRSVRDRLHDQFSRLEQGSMTVSEYEARFHELSRHTTMILPTEGERVRCFVRGLRYHLRVDTDHMVSAGRSFLDVVDHARSMEHIHREAQGGSDKRARYQGSYSESECPRRGRGVIVQAPPTSKPVSAVSSSARGGGQIQNRRESRQVTRGGARGGRSGGRPGAPGRGAQGHFYAALTRAAAEASDDVISGTLFLCHQPATVLLDPGSTFSYVSIYFALRLGMRYESLEEPVHVSTPIGEFLVVDQVLRSCLVTIQGYDTRADLIMLDMIDFDVILGMDWLSPYHAVLDCYAKTVTLSMPGVPLVLWQAAYSHTPTRIIFFI